MEEEFLPYELSLKLKELGFDESDCTCLYFYHYDRDGLFSHDEVTKHINWDMVFGAPLWQQAFDWFREKYELHSCILVLSKLKWTYVITNFTDYVDSDTQILKAFETYEEAREACLLKLIELCKE